MPNGFLVLKAADETLDAAIARAVTEAAAGAKPAIVAVPAPGFLGIRPVRKVTPSGVVTSVGPVYP